MALTAQGPPAAMRHMHSFPLPGVLDYNCPQPAQSRAGRWV